MQGFMILAIIGTEKDTLVLYSMQMLTDGRTDRQTDRQTFEQDSIYVAMFSYFGYLCGYFPLRGLDTQETNLATKISTLRNKSHLY